MMRADLDPIPLENELQVEADCGPSDVRCNKCGLLMLPWHEETSLRGTVGRSEWICMPCYRGVGVTWAVIA